MADAPIWALGLMSGTSMDGVDAALIRTDGDTVDRFGPALFRAYTDAERSVLRQSLADATAITDRRDRPGSLADAERIVTDAHIAATADLISTAKREGIAPDIIGFHGQTVFHAPRRRLTVQIGDAARLAAALALPVVHDFRAADVAAGGQGAPLVPVYHRALAARSGLAMPVAFLNIGGVANVTIIAADGALSAFDTGPGNALMDDAVQSETGARFDDAGQIAATGRVDAEALASLMNHPYFALPPPKSLDRNAFDGSALAHLALPDRLATLAAFTAEAIAVGLRLAAPKLSTLIVSGGGAHNPVLLAGIADRTGATVQTASEIGLDSDFTEAQAFAYLAVRRLRGEPSTFPATTGCPDPIVCGEVVEKPVGK
jgi:anhydro-N-acetylmuramic acid kinase